MLSSALALVFTIQRWRDPDVWWHLATGRLILRDGIPTHEPFSFLTIQNPWVDQQWGYEVLLARLTALGGPGLPSLVMGAVALAGFLLAIRSVRRPNTVGGLAAAGGLALSVLVAAPLLGVRGQVFTVLGSGISLYLLSRWREGSRTAAWCLVPLTVIWANLHAGSFTGIALALAVVITVAACRRLGIPIRGGDVGPLAGAIVGSVVGSLLTPAGLGLWTYVAQTFTNSTLTQSITEWQSPDFHNIFPRLFAVEGALLLWLWYRARGRIDIVDVVLATGTFAAGLQAQRNVALFAVVAAPQIAFYGADLGARGCPPTLQPMRRRIERMVVPAGALAIVATLGSSWLAVSGQTAAVNEAQSEPVAAATWVAHHAPGRHLYSTYEWTGYLAYRFPSQRVVFVYGESAVFGTQWLQAYLSIHNARADWKETLMADGDMRVAIVPASSQEWTLFSESGWRTTCFDASSGAAVMEAPISWPHPDPRNTAPSAAAQASACSP